MESKDFWLWILRKALDIFEVSFVFCELRGKVDTWWREFVVVVVIDSLAVEIAKDDCHKSSIFVICYSTTIVTFTSQVVESIKRNLLRVFIDENEKLLCTYSKIWFIELILDIPSKGSKLFSLLNEGMEEAQTEQHLSEDLWKSTWFVPCFVRNRISTKWAHKIGLKTHWRFVSHLNSILEDRYWESKWWIRC